MTLFLSWSLWFQGFLQAGEPSERRCDAKEALTSRGCKEPYLPETEEALLMKDKELSASDDIIQLRPQQIDFQLRVGEYGRPGETHQNAKCCF